MTTHKVNEVLPVKAQIFMLNVLYLPVNDQHTDNQDN